MSKKIIDDLENKWKIVLLKTIDNREPVLYRVVNLGTYEVLDIPAYRILDEVINNKMNIINLRCENNKPVIIDEYGYTNTNEIIVVDELDSEVPNLYDWAISSLGKGGEVMARYDYSRNLFAPSNYKIDSSEKVYWECEHRHVIHCEFSVFFGIDEKCPVCNAIENNKTLSLKTWAMITGNTVILKEYDKSENNEVSSDSIPWNSTKKVYFKRKDEEVQSVLRDYTIKSIEPPFEKNVHEKINLSR